MTRVVPRFVAVGSLATAVDVCAFLLLRVGARLPVVLAVAVAILVATPVSYALNRVFTFGDDPYVRWVQHPASYAVLVVAAAAVDLTLVAALAGLLAAGSDPATLLLARFGGLVVGGTIRLLGYRIILFDRLRGDQRDKRSRPVPPGDIRFSVVVPAFREGRRIAATVARIREAVDVIGDDVEVIVVDDGSDDETAEVAATAGAAVVRLPVNRGKGAAVRAGVAAARGRAVAYTDADLSYAPGQLVGILACIEDGWDMVVGSRAHVDTRTLVAGRRLREVSGRFFNVMTYLVLLGRYRDTQCGLKGFRRDVADALFAHARIDRFAFDVELFHLAERYRLSLLEVPVTLAHSSRSSVRVAFDAWQMVRDLFRVRWWASRGVYDLSADEAAVLER